MSPAVLAFPRDWIVNVGLVRQVAIRHTEFELRWVDGIAIVRTVAEQVQAVITHIAVDHVGGESSHIYVVASCTPINFASTLYL